MNSKLFIDKIKDFNEYPFCIQAVLIKCKNCYGHSLYMKYLN